MTSSDPLDRVRKTQRVHNRVFYASLVLVGLTLASSYAVWKTGNDAQQAVQDEANLRIAATNAKASEAERKLRELQVRVDQRIISKEQFLAIRDTLLAYPKRTAQVICPSNNAEAYGYAKQITQSLEAAHWDTGAGTLRKPMSLPEAGIFIAVRESERVAAQQLMHALSAGNISSRMNATPAAKLGVVEIYVGPRP